MSDTKSDLKSGASGGAGGVRVGAELTLAETATTLGAMIAQLRATELRTVDGRTVTVGSAAVEAGAKQLAALFSLDPAALAARNAALAGAGLDPIATLSAAEATVTYGGDEIKRYKPLDLVAWFMFRLLDDVDEPGACDPAAEPEKERANEALDALCGLWLALRVGPRAAARKA
jgi:hypothetical protein